jgi:hypothetical protein
MKKCYIELGAIFVALLMMSTVTAVQQTKSESVINVVNNFEQKKDILETQITRNFLDNTKLGGLIDLLIQLITLLIQLVLKAVEVVQSVIGLVNMIQNLIDAFTTLFQLIQDLIDLIKDIFNPEPSLTI